MTYKIYDDAGHDAAKNRLMARHNADILRAEADALLVQVVALEDAGRLEEAGKLQRAAQERMAEADKVDPYRKPPKLKVFK